MAADACEDAEEDGLDDDFGQDVLADEDGEEVEEDRSDHDSGMEEHVIDLIENGKEEAAETAEGFEVAAPEIPVEPPGVPELAEERCTLQREPIGGWVYSNDSCELVGRVWKFGHAYKAVCKIHVRCEVVVTKAMLRSAGLEERDAIPAALRWLENGLGGGDAAAHMSGHHLFES